MRVMLLGAAGQLGRAFAATAPAMVSHLSALGGADLDIGDKAMIRRRMEEVRPDLVVNAAAWTDVEEAEREPHKAYAINAVATGQLTEAAADHGARLVHISTDFLFDGGSRVPYRPEDPTNLINAYGLSKAAGEKAVGQYLPDALIVRTAWLYGHEGRNFRNTMLRLLETQEVVRVVADQIGAPTHVRSLARGVWQLVEHQARGVHHLADGGEGSWYDFACAIRQEALDDGLLSSAALIEPVSSAEYPTLARRPAFSVLDCSASRAWMDCVPRHWREELHHMTVWKAPA
jgi:dTDP-4-dehydrorhamnose reductase